MQEASHLHSKYVCELLFIKERVETVMGAKLKQRKNTYISHFSVWKLREGVLQNHTKLKGVIILYIGMKGYAQLDCHNNFKHTHKCSYEYSSLISFALSYYFIPCAYRPTNSYTLLNFWKKIQPYGIPQFIVYSELYYHL